MAILKQKAAIEDARVRKTLVYAPERNAFSKLSDEEFVMLAANYVDDCDISDELALDLCRVLALSTLKSYYSICTDSMYNIAPLLRYIFDKNVTLESLEKEIDKTYILVNVWRTIQTFEPVIRSEEGRKKYFEVINLVRKIDLKDRIAKDRA